MQAQKEPQPQTQKTSFFGKFNIFLLTKTAQNAYGLKNREYSRYRNYCNHKIIKLRQSLSIKLGTKTKFIRKDIVKEKPNDSKILQLILFNAEKNWAFANQTKLSQSRKASQKARARFYSIKKLKRALFWARELKKVCANKTQSITQLEAHAYELFLEGSLQFQRQNWAAAQVKLIACREIMSDVGKVSDSLSEKVFNEKIDQIDQTIKFCNFKISKGKQLSITEIVELRKGGDASLSNLIESLTEKKLSEMKIGQSSGGQIYFGIERYPIKQGAIITKKAKIDEFLANLEVIKQKWLSNMTDDQLYDQLLLLYSDFNLQIQEAIKIVNSERQDPKKKEKYTQGQLQILKKISFLFQEIKLQVFIDRNLIVFKYSSLIDRGRKSSPQTIAKLLTATISLFQQLSEIIKQKGQISNTFQIEHVQAIDAKNFYLRTLRLSYVGQVYFNNKKYKEAYGLWSQGQRCLKILLSKQEMNENKDDQKFINTLVSLSTIKDQIRVNKCRCLVANFEHQQIRKEEIVNKINQMAIQENQTRTQANNGQFFDIFFNELVYPQVQSKIKKASSTTTATKTTAPVTVPAPAPAPAPAPKATSWWGRIFK